MAVTIKHAKTDTIADWTQSDLDAQIAAGNYPAGTVLADIVLPSDWNNDHTISGTIPIANGGTGETTANAAINALLPSQTSNVGKVLTTDGTNTSWQTNGTGTVTSVTGTAPVSVATGTTTPVISMAAATGSVNGYLTSTDWTTFNSKAPATSGTSILYGNGSGGFSNVTVGSGLSFSTGTLSATGSMTYPGAGIPNSTGTAWGTSYTTTGSGTVVALGTNPSLYNPNIDVIDFDTTYATTLTTGQLGWDSTNNALAYGMANGNIVQHIGEDQYLYVKASSAITKGQVCMFTGSVGASGVLTAAPATGITDGTYIMGVAAESIALNGFGFVQTFGVITNVNTTGFADGDILWYNPSVTGGLTNTKPSAPNVKVQVAACNKGGSAGGGVITVRVNPGSQLGGTDSNAQITAPVNGQFITYDGTNAYWKNTTPVAGTGISLSSSATGVLTVTNSLPDQTVAITGAGGAVVTGTYPNFTITTPSGTVTSVTGTAPIASTGGATPAISISQATTSTDGYLSSTDWNTFNNKQPAGTYVTSVGATSPITSTGGTTPTIAMPAATGSVNGYLTSTDWTTFNSKGSGSVTTVSVASANGFAGTVANASTTPAITLTTSISGMLKGNGTAISAGTAGTDYVAPATATNFTAQQYFGNVALTDAATISWAANTQQVATFTFVSSNRTMGAPTGLVSGAFYALAVIQNGGSNTLTWNSVFKWTGGTAPTLSTAAGAKDYFVFRSDGTNLYEQGRSLGVA